MYIHKGAPNQALLLLPSPQAPSPHLCPIYPKVRPSFPCLHYTKNQLVVPMAHGPLLPVSVAHYSQFCDPWVCEHVPWSIVCEERAGWRGKNHGRGQNLGLSPRARCAAAKRPGQHRCRNLMNMYGQFNSTSIPKKNASYSPAPWYELLVTFLLFEILRKCPILFQMINNDPWIQKRRI